MNDSGAPRPTVGKHRLEALSDGVYAIALTLLALDLKLPIAAHGVTDSLLRQALVALMPKGLAWLLSFCVIAMFWVAQQRLYRYVATLDAALIRIELMILGFVTLLPFTTALMGEHGDLGTAATLYAANLVAIAALAWLRASHFLRHPALQTTEITAAAAHAIRMRARIFLGTTLAALALGFVIPGFNMLATLPALLTPLLARE